MASTTGLHQAVSDVLGARVLRMTAVRGGDINQAYKVEFEAGPPVFVKAHQHAPPGMFAAEAAGLRWLAEAGAIKVPEVLAVSDSPSRPDAPAFLALAFVDKGKPGADFSERLGNQLARLHLAGAAGFGWPKDNYIATLPQHNASAEACTWAEFYRKRRLEPQLRRARERGWVSSQLGAQFDLLFARLEQLVGPPEPPARLHGDLWSGNHMCDEVGHPVVFDPAVYGGHREVDLAMMRLFGGYPEAVFDAYHDTYPLLPGHRQRVALYQLYPLLVHVNLFQGAYVSQLEAAVGSTLRGS